VSNRETTGVHEQGNDIGGPGEQDNRHWRPRQRVLASKATGAGAKSATKLRLQRQKASNTTKLDLYELLKMMCDALGR